MTNMCWNWPCTRVVALLVHKLSIRSFFGKIANPSILGRLVNLIITHLLLFPFPKRWIEVDCDFLGQENKNTWAVHISALSVLILLENQRMLINTCNALNAVQSVGRRGHGRKLFFNLHHSRRGQTNPQVH